MEGLEAPAPPQVLGQKKGGEFELVMLQELQNDLARARLREIFYVTVVFHLVVLLLLIFMPRWFPVHETSLEDQLRNQQMSILTMPGDMPEMKKTPAPKSSMEKRPAPQIDRKTLDDIRKSEPVPEQAKMEAPALAPPPVTQNPNPPALPVPEAPKPNPFASQHSTGSSLASAMRNATSGRMGYGDMRGLGPGGQSKAGNGVEILSDTQGVNFDPYMRRVVHDVEQNWYKMIPEEAMAPLLKRGRVVIEFYIMPNGKVMGMKVVSYSGDTPLDRAAWGGISYSAPFPPLPSEFHGPYLALRFSFYYNPRPGDIQ